MKVLFLCLGTSAWGESIHALLIANQISKFGHDPFFVVNERNRLLFAEQKFEVFFTNVRAGHILEQQVEGIINDKKIDYLILSDYFSTSIMLDLYSLNINLLSKFNLPIIAIDTWNSAVTGYCRDLFNKDWLVNSLEQGFSKTVVPVPFSSMRLDDPNNCNFLPDIKPISNLVINQIRSSFGFKKNSKLVLFCTSSWQTPKLCSKNVSGTFAWLPQFITYFFQNLNKDIVLLDVGENELQYCKEYLGKRYVWLSLQEPGYFHKLLCSCDVLLTANIASTIIPKAIVLKKPMINLFNPHSAGNYKELLNQLCNKPEKNFDEIIKQSIPIFPSYLCPIGYYNFLEPLIAGNNLLDSIINIDIFDSKKVIENINHVLYDKSFKSNVVGNITKYKLLVNSLPNIEEMFSNILN